MEQPTSCTLIDMSIFFVSALVPRHHGRKCARAEIKEAARTKLARARKKTGFIFCYQLSRNPASDLGAAENFTMDPVEAERNRRRSLRNMRESARRQENSEQARRETRNVSLRSRRQQECAEQLEQRRQARNNSLRSKRQQESTEQMEERRQPERQS